MDFGQVNPKKPRSDRTTDLQKFWKRVEKTDSCWLWTGMLSGNGYGQFGNFGALKNAHRFAWEMANATPVPDGMYVCHSCDNKKCVNPAHLFIGTPRENTVDAAVKGLKPHGERHHNAKLTLDDVRSIRQLLSDGFSLRVIANQFSVSKSNISQIKRGLGWVLAK